MNIFQKIINLGVDSLDGNIFITTTRTLNGVALLVIPIISCYMIFYLYTGQPTLAIVSHLIYITVSILILFFQYQNKPNLVHWITAIGYNIAIVGSCLTIGNANHVVYFLMVSGVGSALLFTKKIERRIIWAFTLLCIIGVEIYYLYYPAGLLGVKFPIIFNFINSTLIFSLVFAILENTVHTRVKFQHELLEKNNEIMVLNTSLEEKVKERTQKLEEKSKALELSNHELQRFSYISSHDLREPLRNVMGFVQLLKKDVTKQNYENVEEYTSYITWAVNRLDRITRDIEVYSSIDLKEEEIRPVHLNELVLQIAAELKILKSKEGAAIEIDDLPIIKGSPNLFKSLFFNLIENGLTYSSTASPLVQVSVEEQEQRYLFQIKDNGKGIAKAHHQAIFEMFYRLSNDKDTIGSGIGLAICKKIVTLYGGEIWVESAEGQGSTFFFTLQKS